MIGPDRLEELIGVQREMLKWIKFTSVPQLKRTLETVLTTDSDKLIFEHSDGQASTRAIAGALGVSNSGVALKLNKWAQLGIVERLPSGLFRRLCSLGEVGIDVPEIGSGAAQPKTREPEEEVP